MATNVAIPHASARIALEDGRPSSQWYQVLSRLVRLFNDTTADLDDAEGGLATKAAKEQAWHDASLIEFADDKEYRIIVNAAYGVTITSVTTRSTAGTCTVTVSINGTPLGGTANSVSTSEATQAHASANVVAAGDDIEITISDNSGAEGVSVNLRGTRTFA